MMFEKISKDTLLTPADVSEYKKVIDYRVSLLVVNGALHYGNMISALEQPRRGWMIRGILESLAEKSSEHSIKLEAAGTAYCCNPQTDASIEVMGPMFKTHDHIDSVYFDIVPGDLVNPQMKLEMEEYGINKLYSSLKNGVGKMFHAHYERFVGRKIRESQVGFILDKQCAATQARQYQNTFDMLVPYYRNPEAEQWLLAKYPDAGSLDAALDMIYSRLGEFYIHNKKRITEPFFRQVADEVERFGGAQVYRHYYNLLSTLPINEFK